ncbi:MAG TPA: hypothetical protein VI703_07865 [Anaerolineales bacterium]|nr:hypothetical protein [Anaerolineales bacterium]
MMPSNVQVVLAGYEPHPPSPSPAFAGEGVNGDSKLDSFQGVRLLLGLYISTHLQDSGLYLLYLINDLPIRESHHFVSECIEIPRPHRISIPLLSMYLPIDFNNQPGLCAIEVDNEIGNAMLAPKFIAAKVPIPQLQPEVPFRRGQFFTELQTPEK